MGIVTRLGKWLDKRFPEKVTAEDVEKRFDSYDKELTMIHQGIEALDIRISNSHNISVDIEKLKADVQKLQALAVMKPRVPIYNGNMNAPNVAGPVSK